MLTNCPECSLQISDRAATCPHCGYPLAPSKKRKPKRRRLPNGFGRISEIKGQNLRKPFRVMVSQGKDENGRPVGRLLKPEAYFDTYNHAYEALVKYHANPYDLDDVLTVQELYERWSTWYFSTLSSKSSVRTIEAAWNYCDAVKDMQVRDVRARHVKGCIEHGKYQGKLASPNTQNRIKSLWNLMLDYAVEYELTDRNYARTFDQKRPGEHEVQRGHMVFTTEEILKLWSNVLIAPYADVVLIQCYSGWRPQELGLIKLEDVDLTRWTFSGGIKTAAGKDRVVPIHTSIRPLVEKRYHEAVSLGSKYLINCTDGETHRSSLDFTYDKYQKRFSKLRDQLKLHPDHRPHDGRKTFITMAKENGVDEYAIKRMVGHAIQDVTEKIYTERSLDWLASEMQKIKGPD